MADPSEKGTVNVLRQRVASFSGTNGSIAVAHCGGRKNGSTSGRELDDEFEVVEDKVCAFSEVKVATISYGAPHVCVIW